MKLALIISAIALYATPTLAHEFWIEPTTFRPTLSSKVGVQLFVGDGFPGEVRPRDPNKLARLFAMGPQGEQDIPGVDGMSPAGTFVCEHSGVYVFGYRSKQSLLTLDATKFETYLEEEGLQHVVQERARLGEAAKAGIEHYSRAAKCLVRTAKAQNEATPATQPDSEKSLGFPAEVTPHGVDPTTAVVGTELTFLVTQDGKPAANVLVMAFNREQAGHVVKLHTDDAGLVRLTPEHDGMWMVANVYMKRANSNSGADWESVWASLTFDIAPASEADTKRDAATTPKLETQNDPSPKK